MNLSIVLKQLQQLQENVLEEEDELFFPNRTAHDLLEDINRTLENVSRKYQM